MCEPLHHPQHTICSHMPQRNFFIPDDVEVSEEAVDLLKSLICSREKRLGKSGISEFKKHPFFRGIDWDAIHTQTPPYVPTICGSSDTSNFDEFEPVRTRVSVVQVDCSLSPSVLYMTTSD